MGVILINGNQPIESLEDILENFVFYNYVRILSWNQRSNLILNSKYSSAFVEFQEESINTEIFKKLKDIIHILKEEGINSRTLEETSSRGLFKEMVKSTLVISFERTISIDEQLYEELSSNRNDEEAMCNRTCEETSFIRVFKYLIRKIFKNRDDKDTELTVGKIFRDPSHQA